MGAVWSGWKRTTAEGFVSMVTYRGSIAAGTYRLREMKHDDALVDNVEHGSVPVLRYCKAHHSSRSFSGCRTAMNNTSTVG